MTQSRNHAEDNAVEAFIDRWRDTGGKERANYQLFLTELCQLLDLRDEVSAAPIRLTNTVRSISKCDPDGRVRKPNGLQMLSNRMAASDLTDFLEGLSR